MASPAASSAARLILNPDESFSIFFATLLLLFFTIRHALSAGVLF